MVTVNSLVGNPMPLPSGVMGNPSDLQLRMRYQASEGLTIQSSRYDRPGESLLKGDRKGYREQLGSYFERGPITDIRLSPDAPATSSGEKVPGPAGITFPLPPDRRQLVGVARWPDPQYNKESSDGNKIWGERMHATVMDAGQRLSEGKISTFKQLWQFAVDARVAWDPNADGLGSEFGKRLHGRPDAHTPITGPYAYLASRFDDLPTTKVGQAVDTSVDLDQHSFEPTEQIGDITIPLTRLKLADDLTAWSQPTGRSYQKYYGVYPTEMEHMGPQFIPHVLKHVESLVEPLLKKAQSPEELMPKLGEIHWWLTQAMPDARGSAAKAELSVRALGMAHGIDIPPFKHGIVPDLESFTTDRETFSAGYAEMFEPSPALEGAQSQARAALSSGGNKWKKDPLQAESQPAPLPAQFTELKRDRLKSLS